MSPGGSVDVLVQWHGVVVKSGGWSIESSCVGSPSDC